MNTPRQNVIHHREFQALDVTPQNISPKSLGLHASIAAENMGEVAVAATTVV